MGHGWTMSYMLLLGTFKWVEETSQFSKYFIENYNEDSDTGYFLEVDLQYPEELHEFIMIYHFLRERMKIKKVEKLVAILHDKKENVMDMKILKHALNHG